MMTYRATSDASMIYREHSGLDCIPSLGSADCGNLAAFSANSTFLFSQTVFVPIFTPIVCSPQVGECLKTRETTAGFHP
jgi:hypothetical protein